MTPRTKAATISASAPKRAATVSSIGMKVSIKKLDASCASTYFEFEYNFTELLPCELDANYIAR